MIWCEDRATKSFFVTEKMAGDDRRVSQNSAGYSRTVEKAFEDSEYSGALDLCGHKLTELPYYAGSFELTNLISIGTTFLFFYFFIFIFILRCSIPYHSVGNVITAHNLTSVNTDD